MDKAVNGTPALSGMIPLAGLSNAYDADYDPESAEVIQPAIVNLKNLIAKTMLVEI